jgi:hypothetical protein
VRVFVSSQAVTHPPAADLIQALRSAGASVEHSPINPSHGSDPRWSTWYADLADAIVRSDAFVAVIDGVWDSSTWMASEADAAKRCVARRAFWNPNGVRVTAVGMRAYLENELPQPLAEAVVEIVRRAG